MNSNNPPPPDPLAFLSMMLQQFGPQAQQANLAQQQRYELGSRSLDLEQNGLGLRQSEQNERAIQNAAERDFMEAQMEKIQADIEQQKASRSHFERLNDVRAREGELGNAKTALELAQQNPWYIEAMFGDQPDVMSALRPMPALTKEEVVSAFQRGKDGELTDIQQMLMMKHPKLRDMIMTFNQGGQPLEN